MGWTCSTVGYEGWDTEFGWKICYKTVISKTEEDMRGHSEDGC
jgi:hypothetical protein